MQKSTKIIFVLAVAAAAGIAYLVSFNHTAIAGGGPGVEIPPEPLEVNIVTVSNPNAI